MMHFLKLGIDRASDISAAITLNARDEKEIDEYLKKRDCKKMNKYYAKVTIEQTSDTDFNICLSGNCEGLLKGLAGAVTETITSAPESIQQFCRSRFLEYLNQSTVEECRKEM